MPGPYILLDYLAGSIEPSPETHFDSTDAAFTPHDPPSMFDGVDGQLHWLDDLTPETPASTPSPGGHFGQVDLGQQMRDLELFCDNLDNSTSSNDAIEYTGPTTSEENPLEPGLCRYKYNGSKRSYQRTEQLMRHQEVENQNHERHICEFCGREFFRKSNLNSHRWRHTKQGGKNRVVKFYPEAYEILSKERSMRTRRTYLPACSSSGHNDGRNTNIDACRTEQ